VFTGSLEEVEEAIAKAYADERKHMASEVLSPLPMAMDLETFEKRGRARLGEPVFSKLLGEIQALDPRVELLVFGFDAANVPHIFKTSTLGDIQSCDATGFGAIGTGSHVATDLLNGSDDLWISSDIGLITYRLCEAKFVAEGADGVGPGTMLASFGPEGLATLLQEKAIDTARSLWRRRRKAKVPEHVLGTLRRAVSLDREHGIVPLTEATNLLREVIAELKSLLQLPPRESPQNLTAESVEAIEAITNHGQIVSGHVRTVTDGLTAWTVVGKKPPEFDEALWVLLTGVANLKQLRRDAGVDV
jgi:hypothetical protein